MFLGFPHGVKRFPEQESYPPRYLAFPPWGFLIPSIRSFPPGGGGAPNVSLRYTNLVLRMPCAVSIGRKPRSEDDPRTIVGGKGARLSSVPHKCERTRLRVTWTFHQRWPMWIVEREHQAQSILFFCFLILPEGCRSRRRREWNVNPTTSNMLAGVAFPHSASYYSS